MSAALDSVFDANCSWDQLDGKAVSFETQGTYEVKDIEHAVVAAEAREKRIDEMTLEDYRRGVRIIVENDHKGMVIV